MAEKLRIVYYVEPDAAALARRAARVLCREVREQAVAARGRARIAISGGSTPKAAFAFAGRPGATMARADAVGQAGPVVGG